MKVTDIYFYSGTHWDREWYQNFQSYRYRLVEMVDDMIDYLESDDKFGTYQFDGQTIVLEDYTEIAPDNEERLKALIGSGRIKIGPWYCMPDEFLLSGESLIRNIMRGSHICRKWGVEPWKVGYACDIFGHIAQMPQIYNGFGINFSILGRGTTEEDEKYIRWKAPDGSECVVFLLEADGGYANIIKIINSAEDREDLKAKLKEDIDRKIERANAPVVILMDGWDHNLIHKDTPDWIEIIKEIYPDINVHHCTVENAAKQLEEYKNTFPVKNGELNKTAIERHSYLHLITNTLSSHYPLKKANDECQNILEKKTEPLGVIATLNGKRFRHEFIETAYKYLLQNHPHDSICGCSVDQVHKDMVYRFDQVKEITGMIEEEFLFNNRPEKGDSSEYLLRLYNPLPFDRCETVTAEVILKNDYPCRYSEPFDYEEISGFKLYDIEGNEIPYGRKEIIRNYKKRVHRILVENGECYKITFDAKMPACGYSEYRLVPSKKPVRYFEKLKSGVNFAENDYVKVTIQDNGEITLFDKKTKTEYKNLCGFADDGEMGDGWYHANPANDKVIYSCGGVTEIERIENSPSRCVFRVKKEFYVPEKLENLATGYRRSDNKVKLSVTMEIGLSGNNRFADVKMTVNNAAKDHRLRLIIPTGIEDDSYFAGQAFCCVERKTGIDYSTSDWREHDQYEKAMNGIVGKRRSDGSGIAFVSEGGLHECAAYEDDNIYVTLFRGFEKTYLTMGESAGQLLGDLSYSFMLVPVDFDVTYSELVKLQDRLSVKPVMSCSEIKNDYVMSADSFMKIEGANINLSVMKQAENGKENTVVIRVFNPSAETAEGKIVLDRKILKAYKTNLNEDIEEEIKADETMLSVTLKPWKIQTYLLEV